MKILDAITLFLAAACQAGSDACLAVVMKVAKRTCLMAWLLVAALALLLGALGLMIAALYLGLAPHLGAPWAAMIAAGASLLGSGILMAIALKVSNGR
jgi:hypothetical protein